MDKVKRHVNKIKNWLFYVYSLLYVILPAAAFATSGNSDIASAGAELQKNVMQPIADAARYIGIILIFAGLILWAVKLIVAHGNPHKRSEALESGGWLIVAAIVLGAALIAFDIVVSMSGLGNFYKYRPH